MGDMSQAHGDRLLTQFNHWLLGVFLIVVMIGAGSVLAMAFEGLSIPYGGGIGFVFGTMICFLSISYKYYGY
jgi:hypothetical protein